MRVTSSSSASTRPCADSSMSQNSRTAPSPAGARLRQRTRSTTHGCALAGAAAYVVSPVDLLPEAVLSVVGLADDAVVLAWFATALVQDTDDFLAWEARRKSTVRGQRLR